MGPPNACVPLGNECKIYWEEYISVTDWEQKGIDVLAIRANNCVKIQAKHICIYCNRNIHVKSKPSLIGCLVILKRFMYLKAHFARWLWHLAKSRSRLWGTCVQEIYFLELSIAPSAQFLHPILSVVVAAWVYKQHTFGGGGQKNGDNTGVRIEKYS